jgi:flagellar hook protein FlgE
MEDNVAENKPVVDGATTEETNDASTVADMTGAENENTWNFSETIKGEGEKPEWFKSDKYKTVADQAKAYKELEGKFGTFTGSPEEFEPVELSEELREMGIEINKDDPLLEKAVEFAKESNMSQDGFNKMIQLYAETMAAENMALEDYKKEQIKALGNNAESRINNLGLWGNANLPQEILPAFQQLANSADSVKVLERLVSMTQKAPISNDSSKAVGNTTEAELKAMQFEKDQYGNRRITNDPEFRARFQKMQAAFYG